MEYLIGVILTLAVVAFAAVIGFDRERAFYPTVLIVIASYYSLFAVMGASTRTSFVEHVRHGRSLPNLSPPVDRHAVPLVQPSVTAFGLVRPFVRTTIS